MDTAEEAYYVRNTENVVDDEARKGRESALGTLTQIIKKIRQGEADNRAGSSSADSNPASVTFSDSKYT